MWPLPSVSRFLRFRPRPEHRPTSARRPADGLRVRWLGTAGWVVQSQTTTLLIDPFLSRPSLLRTATRRLRPDPEAWWRWLPSRVDAIFLGHSHYDHLMDAPVIARRSGALFVGSETSASFARAEGLDACDITVVPARGTNVDVGDFTVRMVPSLHGRILAGRVPLPGVVRSPPRLPARFHDYRMGGAFGVHVTHRPSGRALYHNGSADLIDAELAGLTADVALVGLAGRAATPDYLGRLLAALGPSVIVPTHHDTFFSPLQQGVYLLPGVDLPGFFAEARKLDATARVITPTYDETLHLPLDGDAREAVLYPR